MRARMALLASGQQVELREIVLRNKPDAMIAASPKATVPVLVLLDGEVIDESLDVMHWALGNNDPENWLNDRAASLIAHNDGAFKNALDRYKYSNRYQNEIIDTHEQRSICAQTLQAYEQALSDTLFLLGPTPTIADNAIFPFVRQYANVDRDWFDSQPWPHLHRWLTHFLTSARFETAMTKFAPWKTGDAPLIFGS